MNSPVPLTIHNEGVDIIRATLDSTRRENGQWWRALSRTRVVLITVLFAVLAYIGLSWYPSSNTDQVLRTLTALAAGTTFAFSYLQWRLARQEISFDKYYDRMQIANEYINSVGLRKSKNKDEEVDHLRNMEVFAQLDNFEYVLGKYKLNFVDYDIVDRAVRTLKSECEEQWFREKVLYWIGESEEQQVSKGYHANTRLMARIIVGQCTGAD